MEKLIEDILGKKEATSKYYFVLNLSPKITFTYNKNIIESRERTVNF